MKLTLFFMVPSLIGDLFISIERTRKIIKNFAFINNPSFLAETFLLNRFVGFFIELLGKQGVG